jgi:hypothetical protein
MLREVVAFREIFPGGGLPTTVQFSSEPDQFGAPPTALGDGRGLNAAFAPACRPVSIIIPAKQDRNVPRKSLKTTHVMRL